MADYELHRAGAAATIYKDGLLYRAGHVDDVKDWLLDELGVKTVQNDAFMLGQNHLRHAAVNLAAIDAYMLDRAQRKNRLKDIRDSIATLKAEARELGADDA